ncbi:MAG: ATP-binding cassette domain-containing protein [Acetatifactor sp.]|nr:ATP-binding cassette domain-containing protein [Acetatifactor sp.]
MKTAAFTKTYGERTVLRLPELTLKQGEITAVIGANGSGKTTFARVLAGVEPADGKQKVISGVTVGYMPQKSYAFRMSTEKNIALNGGDRERARRLISALQIETLKRQRAKKLSGGETAKMALARLLMRSYELLILDEPTASMDMESVLSTEVLLERYCRETGCAMLIITHNIQQARRVASETLFLCQGELAERGSTAQVLSAPEDERTCRFLKFHGV